MALMARIAIRAFCCLSLVNSAQHSLNAAPPPHAHGASATSQSRNLITGATGALFTDWIGVLRLEFPYTTTTSAGATTSKFVCTGTLTDPTIIITAPQCLPNDLRSATSATDWDGKPVTLGTQFKVYAGDAAGTEVGFMLSAQYVNAPAEGSQMAAVRFSPNAAGVSMLGNTAYPYLDNEPAAGQPGTVVGYGPDTSVRQADSSLVQTGAGVMRNATMLITSTGTTASAVSKCFVRSYGGQLNMMADEEVPGIGTFNTVRLCALKGDLGAPFFVRDQITRIYYLAGIFVATDDNDCVGSVSKPDALMSFTSLAYRKDWVKQQTDQLNGNTYVPPACPSGTPSSIPSPTATRTPSRTPSSAPILVIPETPAVFFQRQVNVVWMSILGGLLVLMMLSICAYVRWKQAKISAFMTVDPKLKAILRTPAVGQKGPAVASEYEVSRQAAIELARTGDLITPARRMSALAISPEDLAAQEAGRAARKERRRSSIVGGPISGRDETDKQRRGSTTGPLVGGHRRRSLAMARTEGDRAYDMGTEATAHATKFSAYEGRHVDAQHHGMLAPGVVPLGNDDDDAPV